MILQRPRGHPPRPPGPIFYYYFFFLYSIYTNRNMERFRIGALSSRRAVSDFCADMYTCRTRPSGEESFTAGRARTIRSPVRGRDSPCKS